MQPVDFFGDGTRIPLLVVSAWARRISHDYIDHVSILKFVEPNWRMDPVTRRSRDNLPNPVVARGNPYVPLNSPAIGDLFDLASRASGGSQARQSPATASWHVYPTNGSASNIFSSAQRFLDGRTADQAYDMFDVNVLGIQRTTRAALPAMRAARSGLIVNIGSILGRVTIPFVGLYGATKHAVEAMTESYRYELSQLGVDVVLVQPSAYPTNLYSAHQEPADAARAPAYGEVADVPKGFVAYLQGLFAGADAPDPHDVAAALARLVDTPAGMRPDRVVVGNPFGAADVNEAVRPIRGQLVEALGMGALARLRA